MPLLVAATPATVATTNTTSEQVVLAQFQPVSDSSGDSSDTSTEKSTALTYDEEQVPAGAGVLVSAVEADGGTTVVLAVQGLQPDRDYGAHVHVNGCGATGDAAGPHFQDQPDPVTPSTDPAYANPENEIWLDFTTDASGAGHASSTVDWVVGDRPAASVVIHAEHTHTEAGTAGAAGTRLACVNVDF